LAAFDTNFFGLSAMETTAIDPQHRILMECVLECLDKAGYTNSPKSMGQCGFFIGFMGSEYAELADDQENALQMLGAAASTVSGRLAHFFDSRQVWIEYWTVFIKLNLQNGGIGLSNNPIFHNSYGQFH
jgi:acyl transferase domain-containing protein